MLESLPANSGWQITLHTTYKGSRVTLDTITFRTAAGDDAAALLAIYAPYVKGTASSFEYEAPSLEEFQGRIAHTLRRYPYIVAVENGEILGYAYTGPFGERAAYRLSVETSIYLRQDVRGKGLGKRLYAELERICKTTAERKALKAAK